MKFSKEILNTFNLDAESEREPVNIMKIADILQFLKSCADRNGKIIS